MFARNFTSSKAVSQMNSDQRSAEKKRRIKALAAYHVKLGREVDIKPEGIGVKADLGICYFFVGDDPCMLTIHTIQLVQGDVVRLMELASAATADSFAAKVSIGPHPDGHAAHFTVEVFTPDLKIFFAMLDAYTSALITCQTNFFNYMARP